MKNYYALKCSHEKSQKNNKSYRFYVRFIQKCECISMKMLDDAQEMCMQKIFVFLHKRSKQ